MKWLWCLLVFLLMRYLGWVALKLLDYPSFAMSYNLYALCSLILTIFVVAFVVYLQTKKKLLSLIVLVALAEPYFLFFVTAYNSGGLYD